MRYALVVSHDETAEISEEERSRRDAAFTSFQDELRARGVLAGGARLWPADTAATVRCWDGGDVIVTDGPAARAGEQITAFFIVDSQDLDEAIKVATQVPAAWYGTVEVRPARGT
jgi:hypothetical protein